MMISESTVVEIPASREGLSAQVRRWATSGRTRIALRGGAWSMAGYIGTQLLRIASPLILARSFLGPEPFGTVGLVGVFLAGLAMFSELGIVANVVQHKRGEEPSFLNTAFTVQAARGAGIWLIAVLAAYPMAMFYHQPELFPLLVVAGFSEMVRGLTSTAVWTLTRNVELRSMTALSIGSELAGAVVGIGWAVLSPSAWALVARTVATAAAYALGSHFIVRQRVRLGWDRIAARDILNFGGWISIATGTYFLSSQGERLFLGKIITPAELGCFSIAVMIAAMPAGAINQIVSQILLPIISGTARTSAIETTRDFMRARRIFLAAGLVTAFGFLACSKPLVKLLLPPKYAMAGWMLQALGVRVALDVFAAPASTVLLAYGQSKYSAAGSTSRLLFMGAGLWVAFTYFGIHQGVFSLLVAQSLSYFPLILGLARVLPGVGRTELRFYVIFLAILSLGGLVPWPNL
jgi:O-antigen/teichoic acid export membrane protein